MKKLHYAIIPAAVLSAVFIFTNFLNDGDPVPNLVSEFNPIGIDTSLYVGNYRHTTSSDIESFGGFIIEIDEKENSRLTSTSPLSDSAAETLTLLSIGGITYVQFEPGGAWQTNGETSSLGDERYDKNDFIGQGFLDNLLASGDYRFEYMGDNDCSAGTCRIYKYTDLDREAKIENAEENENANPSFSEGTIKVDVKTNRLSETVNIYHSLPKSDPESYVETSTSIYEYDIEIEDIKVPENVVEN